MKKKTFLIVMAVLVAGFLIRFVQVLLNSSGEGRGEWSPNKKFFANAEGFYDTKFWGGKHNYYEFTITSADGRRIQHVVIDEPPQGMTSVREEASIQWAADGSSVTYGVKGANLTLGVNP